MLPRYALSALLFGWPPLTAVSRTSGIRVEEKIRCHSVSCIPQTNRALIVQNSSVNNRAKPRKALGCAFSASCVVLFACTVLLAEESSRAVVAYSDAGFPSADSAHPSPDQLQKLLPGAYPASAEQLQSHLDARATRLLVLSYGSAFPEEGWPSIYQFLQRGGNLLVLGGRPFTRAAYRDSAGWHLRDYSIRFTRLLGIDQFQVTPGSEGLEFQTNSDLVPPLSRFAWKRAFSPVIRLSAVDLYARGGSAGSIDARLDALAWDTRDGRKLAAPALQVDHLEERF